MVRPTINSEKHIAQRSLVSIANGEILNFIFANASASPTNPSDVRVGSIIKAVYVEMWVLGSGSQPVIQTSSVEKLVSGQIFYDACTESDTSRLPQQEESV